MGAVTQNRGNRIAASRIVALWIALGLVGAGVVVGAAPASASPSWSVVAPVTGAEYGHLAAVSCVSPASCFAVGVHDSPSKETRLVERWNGTKWSVVVSPSPIGAGNSQFTSVHCLTGASCVAVGQYETASTTKTLVERWNGTSWSIERSPNPVGVAVSGLAAVQCTSAASCFAVGSFYVSTSDSSAERTLVEHWNGTKWSIVPSRNRSDSIDNGLTGVSCPGTTTCFAVGHSRTNLVTKTLVERWDGTSWSIVASPNPPGTAQSELSGIVCRGEAKCFAVGSGHGTLIERWNGSKWSIVTSPNPTGATGASLTGVSCPGATRCYAVGDFFKGGSAPQRLVETWNGTSWSIVATPAPSGTIRSSLNGIACVTTTTCFAVGEYRLGPSRRPLIERLS